MNRLTFPRIMGAEGFNWFFAVVEDINDPEKLGRIKVRILGLHSEELIPNDATGKGIATDHLPWAWVLKPMGSSSMDGLGWSSLGIQQGSWVFGFSRDGDFYNDLIIMGSVGGSPEKGPDPSIGFNDPDGIYPKILDEPDINRLARNEKIDETIVKTKRDDVIKKIKSKEKPWDEPETPYAAEYPNNEVFESKSGHIIEIDDTEGAERFHVYHKSGTFIEIHPDGTAVYKNPSDDYSLILGDKYAYIKGKVDIVSDEKIVITCPKVEMWGDVRVNGIPVV